MSIKYRPTPLVYALAFLFGSSQFLQSQEIPMWAKIVAGAFCAGMTATGLLKATKQTEEKT